MGHHCGQPAVGSAPGGLLSRLTRALAACVGSVYSTCLPVSPPCLPQAPPAPSQEQFSPPQGTISLDTTSTQPSPGFRGSPDHPAVGRAPGFSPAPSSPLEGLPLGTPSPSGPASQGPLCSTATPALVVPVQAKADLRAGLCTRPSGHSCPMRTLAHPSTCSLLSWSTHASQTQGTSSGPVGLPPRALTLGLGVLKSRGGMGFLESHQHPCQPLPGWLTTAGWTYLPRGFPPGCQERRNKAARLLSAQSEMLSLGRGVVPVLRLGEPRALKAGGGHAVSVGELQHTCSGGEEALLLLKEQGVPKPSGQGGRNTLSTNPELGG